MLTVNSSVVLLAVHSLDYQHEAVHTFSSSHSKTKSLSDGVTIECMLQEVVIKF